MMSQLSIKKSDNLRSPVYQNSQKIVNNNISKEISLMYKI